MHSCGLAAGAAYCWGDNTFGQLGNGSTADSPVPVAVAGGLSFNALSAGGFPPCSGVPCPAGAVGTSHTCGLTSNRAAYCWGAGYGTAPVAVPGGLSFSALAAGRYHTCGLTSADAAYCWGADFDGQLGNGSTSSSATPVAVVGGFRFSALVADDHTCGITTTGALYCWGDNEDGQLGNGTTTSSAIPVAVAGWP